VVTLKPGALLGVLLILVFGAVYIINVHAHEKANDGAGRARGDKSEDGSCDGELEFHGELRL
jgi:hypothetical protein